MKQRVLILALLLSLIAATPIYAQSTSPLPAPPQPGDVYLALGDSLAVGYETAGNQDGQPGYPALLAFSLQQSGLPLEGINLGVVGETSTSMLAPGGQLAQAEARIATLRSEGRRIGLITLGIGGNDVISTLPSLFPGGQNVPSGQMLRAFRTNYAAILDRLRAAAGPETLIVTMNYYNPYPGLVLPGETEARGDVLTPQLNAAIAEIAGARGVSVADVYDAFRGREGELLFVRFPYYTPTSLADPNIITFYDFHPRLAGHQVIAHLFAEAARLPVPQAFAPLVIAG